MPSFSSATILCLRPLPSLPSPPSARVLLRRLPPFRSLSVSLSARDAPTKPSLDKNLLKAKDDVKDLSASAASSLSPELDLCDHQKLLPFQAVGLVAAFSKKIMELVLEEEACHYPDGMYNPPALIRDTWHLDVSANA